MQTIVAKCAFADDHGCGAFTPSTFLKGGELPPEAQARQQIGKRYDFDIAAPVGELSLVVAF